LAAQLRASVAPVVDLEQVTDPNVLESVVPIEPVSLPTAPTEEETSGNFARTADNSDAFEELFGGVEIGARSERSADVTAEEPCRTDIEAEGEESGLPLCPEVEADEVAVEAAVEAAAEVEAFEEVSAPQVASVPLIGFIADGAEMATAGADVGGWFTKVGIGITAKSTYSYGETFHTGLEAYEFMAERGVVYSGALKFLGLGLSVEGGAAYGDFMVQDYYDYEYTSVLLLSLGGRGSFQSQLGPLKSSLYVALRGVYRLPLDSYSHDLSDPGLGMNLAYGGALSVGAFFVEGESFPLQSSAPGASLRGGIKF